MNNEISQKQPIETWKQFNSNVRPYGHLLRRLGDFPNSILVSGCQRSGTTMLARIISESKGMVNYAVGNYKFGPDNELDAALILSGYLDYTSIGRCCFQTTYINEFFHEYYDHIGKYKLVWVIRNPYSVVYSLMNNWPRYALEHNFKWSAAYQSNFIVKWFYSIFGPKLISPLRQACLSYTAKYYQLFELVERLGREVIFVVDYDDVVLNKDIILPQIYQFLELDFDPIYNNKINNQSVGKKLMLSSKEKKMIKRMAESLYEKAYLLKSTR